MRGRRDPDSPSDLASPHLSALTQRIRQILAQSNLSARELSKRAGLAPGHVALILREESTGGERITAKTIAAIARAGGVSFTWLAVGEGAPATNGHGDTFPERLRAIEIAREIGCSEEAIAAGARPTVRMWLEMIQSADKKGGL